MMDKVGRVFQAGISLVADTLGREVLPDTVLAADKEALQDTLGRE